LTLKHKLLIQLGEISHFILKSLLQASLTLEDFESVTQLSKKQLSPVIERLKGFGLIDWQGKLQNRSNININKRQL
jgi:DNA-binding transcriptional regulator GbsR (MarR family)